ncbi:hypothetical protein LPJ61_005846 [Coemansia biformis]|uniref:MARVEL domain-containing protein n=1 Tax=Coemansia biformis TaxID=1286918 RepID=A0A9W7Y1F5_9FUNG|nr:hypothetical protein LPJ61_005846 [Coemansia biformis]
MFVTLATLITIPIIAFGNLLASRGFAFATKSNYIISEVANSVLFTVLWFIAGVVMANYAGDGGCGGLSMCQKFKAATAFAWFPFFVFLCNSVVLVMLLLRVRKNGAPMTTLAYEVDFESGNAPAPGAPQNVDAPYAQQGKNDASYYGSSPQVAMPAPTH